MNKKRFILLMITTLLFSIILTGGCQNKKEEKYNAEFFDLFDTYSQIIGYADDEEKFSQNVKLIYNELNKYHKFFDIYNSYEGINNIKTINDNAGKSPVVVDKEIIELLKYGIEMHKICDGNINIAFGSVLKLWHEARMYALENEKNAYVPKIENLNEANKHTDINNIIIDEEKNTVFLQDPMMSLDVGALAKGFAVQKTADFAKENGFTNLLFNIGGNICTVGPKIDGNGWKVGIQNPDLTSDKPYIDEVILNGDSLVISGNYQRFFEVDGKKYHHIINKDSLMPADKFVSVAVIAKNSGLADAFSTALFNIDYEEGKKLIKEYEDVKVVWIFEDGIIRYSDNFEIK